MPTTTSPPSSTSLHKGPGCGGFRLTDAGSSQRYVLAPGSTTIGAGPKCDLRLDGPGLRPLHCVIVWNEAGATVRRWSAGTSLNGQSFTESPLQDGDRLSVGPVDLMVSTDAEIVDSEIVNEELAEHKPGLLEQEIVECIDGLEVLANESAHEPLDAQPVAEEATEPPVDSESLGDADAEVGGESLLGEPSDSDDWRIDLDLADDTIQATSETEDCSCESEPTISSTSSRLLQPEQTLNECVAEPEADLDSDPLSQWESPELETAATPDLRPIAGLLTLVDSIVQQKTVEADGYLDSAPCSDESDANDDYEYYTDVNWEAVTETAETTHEDNYQSDFVIAESVPLTEEGADQPADCTRARARRLIRTLREERDVAAELRYDLRVVRGERDELTSRVAALQDELDDRDEAIDQLKNEHQATASELAALREDQASLDSMCLELRVQVEQLAGAMNELASAKAEWEAERQQLSLELEAARQELARKLAAEPQSEVVCDDSDQFSLASSDAEESELGEEIEVVESEATEGDEDPRPEPQAVSETTTPSWELTPGCESDSIEPEEACDDTAASVWSVPVADEPVLAGPNNAERAEAAPMVDLWDIERAPMASDEEAPLAKMPGSLPVVPEESEGDASEVLTDSSPAAELAEEPAQELSETEVSNAVATPSEEPASSVTARREYYVAEDIRDDALEPADDSEVGSIEDESVQDLVSPEPFVGSLDDESGQSADTTEFALEPVLSEPEEEAEPHAPFEPPKSFLEQYAHLLPSDEEPDAPASNFRPEPSAPTPEPAVAAGSGDNDEEDIEAYMAQLMQRMRGESVEPRPAPRQEKVNASDQAVEQLGASSEAAAQAPPLAPLLSLDELKRTAAPEQSTDMGSLRMLANESARQAIGVAASKQNKEQSIANLIIAAIAMGIGGYLVASAPGVMSTQLVGGAFALLLAGVWVYRSVTHLLQAVRSGAFDHSSDKVEEALPIA